MNQPIKIFLLSLCSILLVISACNIDNKFEQQNEKLASWHYRGVDDKWRKTYVPGNIQIALQRDTLMESLFFENDFLKNRWSDTVDWEFKTVINIPNDIKNEHYNLVFNGIIGIADIYLNDSLLFRADNMFRTWTYEATNLLDKGKNNLVIKFLSFKKSKEQLNKKSKIKLPFNGLEMMRLAYYYADTTMGVYYIPTGFWKDVYIQKWQDINIEDIYFELKNLVYDESATIEAHYSIISDKNQVVNISIKDKNKTIASEKISVKKGANNYSFEFDVKKPKLWWTYDTGEPYLYNFKTVLSVQKEEILEKETLFGIREISIDTTDHKFVLKLNNVPLTLKIINFAPLGIFNDQLEENKYKSAISDIKNANINMVHVWEGGLYEKNYFYRECDKKGILVWQDFILPFKIFDLNEEIEKNITKEATEAVISLRNHPCIAFWSGQNFFDNYWRNNVKKNTYSATDSIQIVTDNKKLFSAILPEIVYTYSNFYYFEKMDFISIVNIIDDFPSFPNIITIRKIASQNNRSLDSYVVKEYQKPFNAIKKIKEKLLEKLNPPEDIAGFIYTNQLYSAKELKEKTQNFRFDENFNGFITGFYNDYSPAISTSAVDYNGFWKGKMYAIKEAYKKLQIKISDKNGWINIKIKSDFNSNLPVDFYFKLCDFDGDVLWRRNYLTTNIETQKSKDYFSFNLGSELSRSGRNFSVFKIDVFINQELYSEEYYYFVPDTKLKLESPNIKMKYFKVEEGYVIEMTTDFLAKNVYLYTEKAGILDDNFFDIIPGETKKITLNTIEEIYAIEGAFKAIDFTQKNEPNLFNFK
ncbi:MAG: hypothetical protein JXL97_12965 [Bacteroidales bacterium]|nr:hypothetical protein [Bacteroidales bacterium]